MKYTGLCTHYSSQVKAELMANGDTAKYKYKASPATSWLNSGGLTIYSFSSWKALSQPGLQEKAFFSIWKNGSQLSVYLEINRFNAAILPISCCSCFVLWGACIYKIALIVSGLASILLCEIINPRNFTNDMQNAHLEGLSFIP
jgi:hypothetical protein